MLPYANSAQFLRLSYRNGIYQGYFNRYNQQREGYGLVYTTDNNMLMGTTWKQNSCNGPTFIFYNHSHYIYGFWQDSIPHGFNVVRIGLVVIYAWYDVGAVTGRILIVYEQYNTAIVLQQGSSEAEFIQVQKGDVYSDEVLNQYIAACQWPQFQDTWKSLIKFMSAYLINQKVLKPERTKLLLLNQTYFRYGYDEGIAVVFDDQYHIISMGLHQKANLKSLGIRFTKENFIEEGNFNTDREVFAFNYGQRPENKIGKLYSNYLLKSVEFVSQFIGNPGAQLFAFWDEVIKSNLFRKLLAGQITTRKMEISFESPEKKTVTSPSKKQGPTLKEYAASKKQEENRQLLQQKVRLEAYKKEIYDSIGKKSKIREVEVEEPDLIENSLRAKREQKQRSSQIIHKQPVEITTRASRKKQLLELSKSKNRSPIFTPGKYESRSPKNLSVSPFKQKIRAKIFDEEENGEENRERNQKGRKSYAYLPIEVTMYPKHSDANLRNYNSPHEQLDFSRSRGNENEQQVVPLSMRKEMEQEQRRSKNLKYRQERTSNYPTPTRDKKEEQSKKIGIVQKSDPTMSFRNPYLEKGSKKDRSDTGIANIVMSSPYKARSPAKRITTEAQPQNREKAYNVEGLSNRKNNIYLNEGIKADEQPQLKGKKEIKGMTYLEKYKNKNVTPEKTRDEISESKKYNKTIKSFNENNKIYEKVQSPPKAKLSETPKQQRELTETTPIKKKYQYVFN